MTNRKKIATIICAALILVSVCAFSVFACADACANTSLTVEEVGSLWWKKERATATLTKCNCNPVDNTLKVWLRVQYKDGNNYLWAPAGDGIFYYTEQEDAAEASLYIEQDNITYALGVYEGRCGEDVYSTHDEVYD